MNSNHITRLLATTAFAVGLPALAAAQATEPEAEPEATAEATPEATTEATPAVEAEIVPLADWRYDELYTDGVSVEEVLDADVDGPTGEEIGDIENVLFSADGKALSVIAEVGGFLDIGDTHVNVPWDQIEITDGGDTVVLPVTQDNIEDFTLFTDELVTVADASQEITEVEGNGWGTADTGPRVWRAAELIGDYARLTGGGEVVDYGYVDDIIVRDGKIAAVVVSPDVTFADAGVYAYPYYGMGYGWGPAYDYYEMPYTRDEIGELEPLDYEAFDS